MKVNGQHFRTIWLKPDDETVVQLIDQRFLPHRFVIEEVRTVEQMATAIREMHVRGAGLIGASAGYGMYLAAIEAAARPAAAGVDEQLSGAGAQLKATRPTAVNLSWAVERQLRNIDGGKNAKEKVALALRTARSIADEDAEHCNTDWNSFGSSQERKQESQSMCSRIAMRAGSRLLTMVPLLLRFMPLTTAGCQFTCGLLRRGQEIRVPNLQPGS